jgi:hypothetical protein
LCRPRPQAVILRLPHTARGILRRLICLLPSSERRERHHGDGYDEYEFHLSAPSSKIVRAEFADDRSKV